MIYQIMKIPLFRKLTFFFIFLCYQVSAQVNEGDTLTFWSVTYIDWPPLTGTPQRQIQAVCKKVSDYCYVFVEIDATQPSQNSIDGFADLFDSVFYPNLTSKYGPMPDELDNDPRVYILAINEENWSGYFDPGQQMPDSFVYTMGTP